MALNSHTAAICLQVDMLPILDLSAAWRVRRVRGEGSSWSRIQGCEDYQWVAEIEAAVQ